MKISKLYILLILLTGCYVPNDPMTSKFSFEFEGRVERLEDAFFNTELDYKEPDFNDWQRTPKYLFKIKRNDTIIDYTITLEDCQSIYYLVEFDDDWKCKSSYIHIMHYKPNIDSIPINKAKEIFYDEVIDKIKVTYGNVKNKYYWKINRTGNDSIIVDILNQNNELRKRHFFSTDTIMNLFAEKEFVSFIGDSVYIYKKMESQRYMYIESKKTLHNSTYSKWPPIGNLENE